MSMLTPFLFVLVAILLPLVWAQCNPLTSNVACNPVTAFNSNNYSIDFTTISSLPPEWILAQYENVTFDPVNGATFTFNQRYDAPYIWTRDYLLFGHVEVVMKAAPGTGIISSAVLMSDDLDEIDWEFSGNNFAAGHGEVQTNYFGKGILGGYNRGTTPAIADPKAAFHTYTLDWSPSQLVWSVDGTVIRTLLAANGNNYTGGWYQYPQTPARLHLGVWDAGDASMPGGTAYWAGGYTNLSQAPFTMYVKSVKIQNAMPGYAYNYTNLKAAWPGTWQSIQIVNTTVNPVSSVASFSVAQPSTSTLSPILNPSGATANLSSISVVASISSVSPGSTTQPLTSTSSLSINPSVATTNLASTPTATPISTASTMTAGSETAAPAPGPTQNNVIQSCNTWYKVVSGDGCYTIALNNNVTLANFYLWNPDVGTDCSNLWLNYYQCVGVASSISVMSSMSMTTAPPSSGTLAIFSTLSTSSSASSASLLTSTSLVTTSSASTTATTASPAGSSSVLPSTSTGASASMYSLSPTSSTAATVLSSPGPSGMTTSTLSSLSNQTNVGSGTQGSITAASVTTTSSAPMAPTSSPVTDSAWINWLNSVAPGLAWRLCSGRSSWGFVNC